MKSHKITALALICTLAVGTSPVFASAPAENPPTATYNGAGMRIAVLDNGFSLTHESFIITDTENALTKETSDELIGNTYAKKGESDATSFYVSEKIPFAYDYGDGDADVTNERYSDHGTAMISVAAGNASGLKEKNPAAGGAAPEAQVLAMKVYSDSTDSVSERAMVCAIEDAVALGADVILITLADPCGVEFDPASVALTEAVKAASEAGVIVVAPAGDVIEYGKKTIYELEYETADIPTDFPDTGTVAWPGTIPEVLTVGSSESNIVESEFFTLSDGKSIPYGDSNYLYRTATDGKTFASFFDGRTLQYAIIDGFGTPDDFIKAGDITGKIAVVSRGEISFNEKAKNAAARGAVGMIVTDNQPDSLSALNTKIDISESTIPAVIISGENGRHLKNAEDQRISLDASKLFSTKKRPTPSPSSYSAGGTTPELGLKPDLTAVGENVQCASPDGSYASISSTTASAAKVAGMCAVIKQKLLCETKLTDSADIAGTVKSLLVSSAELMAQYPKDTVFSPRTQGGGNANLTSALSAELLLTSNGTHKAELGDGHTRILQFKVTARNLSDTPKECTLDAIIGSDGFSEYTYAELDAENPRDSLHIRLGKNPSDTLAFSTGFCEFTGAKVMLGSSSYELNSASPDYSPYSFTLPAGGSETFEIVAELDAATYHKYKSAWKNGFFIEGFVRLTSGDETSKVPFAGFSGSFAAAPYVEASLYDGKPAVLDGVYVYRKISNRDISPSNRLILGADTHGERNSKTEFDKNAMAFSPVIDRNNSELMLNFGLLRTVSDVSVTVTYSNGAVIEERHFSTVPRTYISRSTGMATSESLPLWNGRAADNVSYIYPDGVYKITVSYTKPISLTKDSFSYDIRLDTEAPKLISADFLTVDDKPALFIKTEDNHLVMRASVVDSDSEEAYPIDKDLYDISELMGEYLYIDIFDYAGNSTVVRMGNPYFVPDVS